jgi:hypothetical protein
LISVFVRGPLDVTNEQPRFELAEVRDIGFILSIYRFGEVEQPALAWLLILRKQRPAERCDRVLLIYASRIDRNQLGYSLRSEDP